jgi:hypothetical protein
VLWAESWYFDFADLTGRFGGYLRVGVYSNLGVTWFWLVLAGDRLAAPVRIVEHRLAPPEAHGAHGAHGAELTVAGDAVSCRLRCDVPRRRWSVEVDAGGHRLDLRWRPAGPVYRYEATTRYEQPARVTGQITVNGAAITVDAPGQRDHSWGVRDWWRLPWLWTASHLDDGTHTQVTQLLPARPFPAYGYVAEPGGRVEPVDRCRISTHPGPDGTAPERTDLSVNGLDLTATALVPTLIGLDGPDGQVGTLLRVLCRVETTDGRAGSAWLEWNLPGVRARTR